jgi:hypothetical protein
VLLSALGLFGVFSFFFTRPARLFDSDAYLHLALARTIGAHGFLDHLEWARFSTLGRVYGDKELLFHLLLVPFVKFGDAEFGGKIALALLCTGLAWSLWELGSRALGRAAFLLPIFVFGSGSFMLRALRLRPELLSVLLLIWVVWALAGRRYWTAAVLACAFSFAHTAFHSLLGLAGLFFMWQRWVERRWEWRLLAATAGGITAGVLAHPQFPRNLSVFWVQNVDFFRLRAGLDVGGEIQPHTLINLIQLDGLFWLGLTVLAVSAFAAKRQSGEAGGDTQMVGYAERDDTTVANTVNETGVAARQGNSTTVDASANAACDLGGARRMASFCWIATAAFGVLFVQMGRFSTFVIPFAALAVSFELCARGLGLRLDGRLRLPGGRAVSNVLALSLLAALSCANGLAVAFVNWQIAGSFDPRLRRELDALALALLPGARVAANWNDAELYAFHMPHARFLNVYDPVFMAVGAPAQYAVWTEVMAGERPDIPAAIARELESEYLAFTVGSYPELERRLAGDPRATLLHRGRHALYRVQSRADGFVEGWTPSPSSVDARLVNPEVAPGAAFRAETNQPVQQADPTSRPDAQPSSYVDARAAIAADGCAVLIHDESVITTRARLFELAAWGPSVLWVDGQQRMQLPAANRARLGESPAVLIRLEPGPHQFKIRTCISDGQAGFYLLDRSNPVKPTPGP